MKKDLSALVYRIIRFFVWLFYPEIKVEGQENLPEGPAIVVGNHAKMNAPIACELYFPGDHYTWTAGEMMQKEEVAKYAYQDFWSHKPGYIKWFFKGLAHFITPFSVSIFNNAHCIGVYHDARLMTTFRSTVTKLQEGSRIIILPEHDVPYNNIVCEFQDRYIDVARLYYRKTKKDLSFVPMYTAPELKAMFIGRPIEFDHTAPIEEERKRITEYLMSEISEIAWSLPEHTVVPYQNIPKREYPSNKDIHKINCYSHNRDDLQDPSQAVNYI